MALGLPGPLSFPDLLALPLLWRGGATPEQGEGEDIRETTMAPAIPGPFQKAFQVLMFKS